MLPFLLPGGSARTFFPLDPENTPSREAWRSCSRFVLSAADGSPINRPRRLSFFLDGQEFAVDPNSGTSEGEGLRWIFVAPESTWFAELP